MNQLGARLKRIPLLVWLAVLALAVALALRLVALDQFPPGVQHDEVFVANFAQTILKGEYPIFFDLNRGNEPLFMYLTALMMRVFGENVWALRATAGLCGFGALLLTWLLARDMFNRDAIARNEQNADSKRRPQPNGDFIALITVIGIAFSFWSLYESRIGLHTISTYLLAAATFYAFWIGWTRGIRWALVLSGVLAGLSTYTYRSGIFVPVTLLVFVGYTLLFHHKTWGRNLWLIPVIFLIAAAVYYPLFNYISSHPETALARLGDLSGDIDALRQGNPVPMLNNAVRVLGMFGVSGDPEWRYNVALRPIFDPLWAALFYIGILIALWRFKLASYAFVLIWLGVMLLPSILSGSDLSQHRAVGAIGAAFILPALTLDEARAFIVRRWGRGGKLAFGAAVAALVLLAIVGGLNAYFVTWANNPEVRLIQRADLATAARWLDEHQVGQRALVSAEFANDLDRGSFNLVAHSPNRAQFFQGADTFVLPARADTFIVNTRSGPIADVFKQEFLQAAPVFESRLADGTPEVQIYELSGSELQAQKAARGADTLAQTADGQITVRDAVMPQKVRNGESAVAQLWWQIGAPQVTDADGLQWNGALKDQSGYTWSEAASLGYTPSQWQSDDMVGTLLLLAVPIDMPPQKAALDVSLTGRQGVIPLEPPDGSTSPIAFPTTAIERGPVPEGKVDLEVRYPSKTKFGDIQLLGSDATGEVEAGQTWQLVLFWQPQASIPANYRLRIAATTESGEPIVTQEQTLLKGIYPTRQWRAGDYIRSIHNVEFPEDAPRGKAVVRVSLWTPDGKPVGRADGAPIAGIEVVGRARTFQAPAPQTARTAKFGDALELVGYDLPSKSLQAGGNFAITLYWHALKPTDKPYTIFVHLLDANGKVIGQKDAPPMNGEAATNTLAEGEFLTDRYEFQIAPDAPAGAASVEIGLYDPVSGARLGVTEMPANSPGDHLTIDGLAVAP